MVSNLLHGHRKQLHELRLLMLAALLASGSGWAEGALALETARAPLSFSSVATPTNTLPGTYLATESTMARAATKPSKAVKTTGSDRPLTLLTPQIVNSSSIATTARPTDPSSQPTALNTPIPYTDSLATSQAVDVLADSAAIAIIDHPPTSPNPDIAPNWVSQTETTAELPWRFVLEPYVYLPLETNGDVTIRNTEVPFDFSLGDVLESLTFAFYGRFEAWKGPWAVVLDGYYFDTAESASRNIPAGALPPGLLPPQVTQVPVNGTAETAVLKLDLAGAYRFGDGNLPNALANAETEFDLGPFVFDAIAGLRLYSFSNDIELSTPLGFERGFSRSDTFVEPMIGGRARWNLSDNLAAIAAANLSGFGIGTDISIESYAGIDWLFSGNTSLTATYRLTYIDYSEGSSGFNLFQHGPAIGVKLRF